MKRALTVEQERQLLIEHQDGWTVNEISIMFKVSVRTVYRTLAKYDVPLVRGRKQRKGSKRKSTKVRELLPCGTNAGYNRHRRKKEYPCIDCLEAHAENVKLAKAKAKAKLKGKKIA